MLDYCLPNNLVVFFFVKRWAGEIEESCGKGVSRDKVSILACVEMLIKFDTNYTKLMM